MGRKMNIHEEKKTTGGDEMVGAALDINNEIKEEPVYYPEEESGIPYFSVNNNPLDVKSEDFLMVEEVSANKEKPNHNFSANNDPLNIKSEDVNIVIANESSCTSIPKKTRRKSTQDSMTGEIIEAVVNVKQENDCVLVEENSTITSGSVTSQEYTFDPYSGKHVCGICGLVLRDRSRLTDHLIVHKSLSEVRTYQCEKCPFKTKRKNSLKTHKLNVHGDPLQLKKYSCEMCSHQTNHINCFKKHLIFHHTPLAYTKENKVYKCEFCDFTKKDKYKIEYHSVVHKKPSELAMNKCPLCPYQSKYPHGVQCHMLSHKSSSETPLYKCELCSFESKWRHCLRNHIKAHEKKSEHPPIRKCESCDFTTNNIYSLETHMKLHIVRPEKPKEIYSCYTCGYQTKQKRYLVHHMLEHKPLSQLELFECAECGFRTKTKKGLRYHIHISHGPMANIKFKPNF